MLEIKAIDKKIVIIAEDIDGRLCKLEADDYNEIVNAHYEDRKGFISNEARVFFAAYAGKPINPFAYTNFLSLMLYIRELVTEERRV